jgi:altronate dehydratase
LQSLPGQPFKVSDLCKHIDQSSQAAAAPKVSAGAVHNAAVKLVNNGHAVLVTDKPASFAATTAVSTRTGPDHPTGP